MWTPYCVTTSKQRTKQHLLLGNRFLIRKYTQPSRYTFPNKQVSTATSSRTTIEALLEILAVVKLKTVQVTKLPLWRKIRKIDMICFAKLVLTESLHVVQKQERSVTCCVRDTLDKKPSIFIRDKHIFSSERMLQNF
jgi:hypothetical protein